MRSVIEQLTITEAPHEELTRTADSLEAFVRSLSGLPRRLKIEGYAESANAGDTDAFFDHSPFIGLSNPLSPPIRLRVEGGRVHGLAVFGSAYEGPPGCVHGGYIAAAFDEVLGFAQSLTGNPGMTGTLTVRYVAPTPLHTELRFEAGVDGTERRKILASGTVHAGSLLTARAQGVFISVDAARFAELLEGAGVKRDRQGADER